MAANRRFIDIRWGDCDPAGIVFYPRYFEILDACTAGLFEALSGLHKRALLDRYGIIGFPMVDMSARFFLPNTFGDRISVETSVDRVGRSSFELTHRVVRRDGGLSIEAHEKRVWAERDAESGKIRGVPIPEELVALLSSE